MNSPKALLPYRGSTFAAHLVQATRHPRVGLTRVVIGANASAISEKLQVDPTFVIENSGWERGPLSSIQTAIRSLPPGETDGLILCPVDHPLISPDLVRQLIDVFDTTGCAIALPSYMGKRGHPAIFRATLYKELLDASLDVGARQVVWAHESEIVDVPTDEEGVVLNLNDPQTLKRALESKAG
jgi:molybdenum cofactor cytidylyltransferase